MPKKSWPAFVKSACNDAWLDSIDIPGREEQVDAFAVRWGGFDVEAFKRALAGNTGDRLFAIFALSYLCHRMRLEDDTWEPPVDLRNQRQFVHVDGMEIPVLSLAYEAGAYEKLGQLERAEMLCQAAQAQVRGETGEM